MHLFTIPLLISPSPSAQLPSLKTADLFGECRKKPCKVGAVNQNPSSRGPGLPWLYSRSSVTWLKSGIHWGTWLPAVVIKSDFCSLNPELLSPDKWKNSRWPYLFQFQEHWSSAWSNVEELCWPGHFDSSFSSVHLANNTLSLEIMCCLLSPRRQDPIFSVKQGTLLEGGVIRGPHRRALHTGQAGVASGCIFHGLDEGSARGI